MKTIRQHILSALYPVLMRFSKYAGPHNLVLNNPDKSRLGTPIHNHVVMLNNGDLMLLKEWRDRKILIVNTASDCGYTAQYKDLQQLHEQYGHLVHILAFPSNDFGEQEKGNDESIIQFCQDNFGVSFPLAKKSTVVRSPQQHPVFQWLSNKTENGWNDQAPKWNFCKYLINEEGVLTHYFDPSIAPLSKTMIHAIQQS